MPPVVSYDFSGMKHIRDGHRVRAVAGPELAVFERLRELERQRNWAEVCDLCDAQIRKTPDWLTPYLCAGVALANLGQETEAILRLEYVEKMAPENPDYSAAIRILTELRKTQKD